MINNLTLYYLSFNLLITKLSNDHSVLNIIYLKMILYFLWPVRQGYPSLVALQFLVGVLTSSSHFVFKNKMADYKEDK